MLTPSQRAKVAWGRHLEAKSARADARAARRERRKYERNINVCATLGSHDEDQRRYHSGGSYAICKRCGTYCCWDGRLREARYRPPFNTDWRTTPFPE